MISENIKKLIHKCGYVLYDEDGNKYNIKELNKNGFSVLTYNYDDVEKVEFFPTKINISKDLFNNDIIESIDVYCPEIATEFKMFCYETKIVPIKLQDLIYLGI